MSITNEGYDFINSYMDMFSFFDESNEINKKYIKELYKNIQYSIEYVNSFNFEENVYTTSIVVNDENRENIINKYNVRLLSGFNSKHVTKDIKKFIKVKNYSFDIQSINFNIVFFILKKKMREF